MGYRSQVIVGIETVPTEAFIQIRTRLLLEKPSWVLELKGLIAEYKFGSFDNNGIHLEIEDWKWCSSYPEVKTIETMFSWFEKNYEETAESADLKYRVDGIFIRIGEDETDIETVAINNGYELAIVDRNISTSFNC